MLKALLKKQFLETASFFFFSGKDGKRRSPAATLGFAALMLYAFGCVVLMFWFFAESLCTAFVGNGLTWVYFAIMGIMATTFACIGSIFTAKSKLYEAKDNELLLSMPVPPWAVLFSRVFSLYLFALFFVAIVFLPAVVQYFVLVGFQILPAVCLLLITLLLPLGALAVCCLLGWLIAIVTARVQSKNIFTLVITLLFLVAYFYAYSKLSDGIEYLLMHGESVGEAIRSGLFPFWQMGLAAEGNLLSLLAFAGIFVGVFALVYWLLTVTFFRIVTMKRGGERKTYKEKERKMRSAFGALLAKEGLRFWKNPLIALNCFLGSLLFLVLPVFALFNPDLLQAIVASPLGKGEVGVILAIVLCFMASSNVVTASSVSLEGETLWQLRMAPVSTAEIFKAKIAFHVLVTAAPALLCTAALCALLEIPVWLALLIALVLVSLTFLCAAFGLAINLKLPNLHWTNEVAAVKQSLSTLLAMFVGWGVSALPIGGFFLFGQYLPAELYLAIVTALFVGASALVLLWLKGRGAKIFETL